MRFNAHFAAAMAVGVFSLSLGTLAPTNKQADAAYNSASQSATKTTDKSSTNTSDNTEAAKTPVKKPEVTPTKITVKPGDSLAQIADSEKTTWVRLYDANSQVDDPNLIYPGQTVVVPTADQKLPDRYSALTAQQVATMPQVTTSTAVAAQSASAAPTQATVHAGAGGANAYVWGTCTWYVKERKPNIGSYWGNAGYSWLSEAQAAGFTTGSVPRPGAIAVTGGHVAIVESVSGGEVNISEMNYGGGVGVVHTRTVPASAFQYIYA